MKSPSRMININWRYSSYLLIIPVLLLYVLAITGCISDSPGLNTLFLTTLKHRTGSASNSTFPSTDVQLRVGYFGLCVGVRKSIDCYVSAMTTTDKLLSELNNTSKFTPQDFSQVTELLTVGFTLQKKIYPPLLAAAGSFFLLGIAFFMLFKWSAKRLTSNPNTSLAKRLHFHKQCMIGSVWISVGLAIASAVSSAEVSAAFQFWSVEVAKESSIISTDGMAIQVMHWLIVGFSVLFALAATSTIKAAESGTSLPGPGGFGGPPGPRPGVPPIGKPGPPPR